MSRHSKSELFDRQDTPLPAQKSGSSQPASHSTRAQRQEFFLPISGFVWFYPEEMKVINHPSFQRLSRINQLGQAHYVYRGATHKRLEHVLGVVSVAEKMISALDQTSAKGRLKQDPHYADALSENEKRFIRLGALLHDIGHLAAGHTLEDELEIVGKHDADKRLSLILAKTDWDGRSCEPLSKIINLEFGKYVPDQLRSDGLTATNIAHLLVRKPPKGNDELKSQFTTLHKSTEIRFQICSNMVGNTICADLLDYIYRDWYHIGKIRSFDDRIFQYMELKRTVSDDAPQLDSPPRSPNDRFVIALGKADKVRTDGVSAILGLLEWRYELAEAVLFHRTKVSAGAMLDRALYELWSERSEDELISKVLSLSDDQLLDVAIDEAKAQEGPSSETNIKTAADLLVKLRQRKIYKPLLTFDRTNLAPTQVIELKSQYSDSSSGQKKSA